MNVITVSNESEIVSDASSRHWSVYETDLPQKLAVGFLVCALASQVVVIMIALGLDSATPAASIMLVQALSEIVNRTFRVMRMGCTLFGGIFCFHQEYAGSLFRCAVFAYNELAFAFLPDYITLLMSLDRVLTFSLWYREKWTKARVWMMMGAMFLFVQLLCLPRGFKQEAYVNRLKGPSCRSTITEFDQVMFLLGVPAVIVTGLLTAKLVYEIKERRRKRQNNKATISKKEDLVTVSLAMNCFVYALFNFIQYSLVLYTRFADDFFEQRFYRGVAFTFGALGTALRGPIYLAMAPMRRAFLRTLHLGKLKA